MTLRSLTVVWLLVGATATLACSSSEQSGGSSSSATGTAGSGGDGGSGATGPGGGGGTGGSGGASTGCAPDYPLPEVGVETFGAVGDGTTDDTVALLAALEHLETQGGTLVLESGKTYVVSDRLEIRDATGFGIQGSGATLLVADGTPTTAHNPLSIRNGSDFVIGDLQVDGNRDNRTPEETAGGHNIRLTGAIDWELCRVVSNNATTDGFYVSPLDNADPSTFPADGVMQDCHADNNFRQGMSIINGRRLQIIDSTFTHTNGTSPQAGVDIEPNSGSAEPGAEHILFRGCRFEGNVGYGLTMGGYATTDRLTVEDCSFIANVHGAMTINAGFALAQNNLVEGHTGWVGFHIRGGERAHDIVVQNNTFQNNPGSPDHGSAWVYVNEESAADIYLLDNTFENNDDTAIADHNLIGACAAGNQIDGQLDAPSGSCGEPPEVGAGT